VSTKISIDPAPGVFAVEIKRYPKDLGVSIVIPATCELAARLCVLKLFPEYHCQATRISVRSVKYVELDWENGRFLVIQQHKLPSISATRANVLDAPRNGRKRREEGAE
jgi:hypothetical protein